MVFNITCLSPMTRWHIQLKVYFTHLFILVFFLFFFFLVFVFSADGNIEFFIYSRIVRYVSFLWLSAQTLLIYVYGPFGFKRKSNIVKGKSMYIKDNKTENNWHSSLVSYCFMSTKLIWHLQMLHNIQHRF